MKHTLSTALAAALGAAAGHLLYKAIKKYWGGGAVTEKEVLAVQAAWADAIANISKVYAEDGDYIGAAAEAAGELYAYGHSDVLFKPTKAAEHPFRPTAEEAMSYFVGASGRFGGYSEDGGFAINGGRGWAKCVHDNHQILQKGGVALAMGHYYFTDAQTGDESEVEYTFGYQRCDDGKVRIFLHHSLMPYKPQKKAAVGVAVPVPATRRDGSPVKASPVVPAVEGKLAEPDGGWR